MENVVPEEEKSEVQDDQDGIDWLLQDLVVLANIGLEIPITLTMPTGVISGVMISGNQYVESLVATMSKGLSQASPEMSESMATWYERWREPYLTPAPEDDTPNRPSYIHLKDARLHEAKGSVPANEGLYWRGKIESVAGFSLSSLKFV